MNVIDWSGPSFLGFYVVALAAAALAWLAIRAHQRGAVREGQPPALDTYELAFLRGGLLAAVEAGLIALHRRGAVALDPGGYRRTSTPTLDGGHRFEQQLAGALDDRPRTRHQLARRLDPAGLACEASLIARGYVVDPDVRVRQSVIAKLPLVALAILGSVKMFVGVARERPVDHLAILLIATAAVALLLPRLSRRTPLGDDALAHHQRRHAALIATARHAPEQLTAEAAPLAYALAGAAVGGGLLVALAGRAIAGGTVYPTSVAVAAGCGSGCGSSFSCGGGGGSSGCGGGDGGGGCGGCGGGD